MSTKRAKNLQSTAREKFRTFLASRALRQTQQRDQVLNVLLGTRQHLSVQEIYDIARKRDNSLGYATVYRTMKLLVEAGICREVDFRDGLTRYEPKHGRDHHDHLICTECGESEEIYSPKIEKLQDSIVRDYGYIEKSHKLEIFGICPRCQKAK